MRVHTGECVIKYPNVGASSRPQDQVKAEQARCRGASCRWAGVGSEHWEDLGDWARRKGIPNRGAAGATAWRQGQKC